MKVDEITPDIDAGALLPGAQFSDAWRIAVDNGGFDARRAAERMVAVRAIVVRVVERHAARGRQARARSHHHTIPDVPRRERHGDRQQQRRRHQQPAA